MVTNLVGSWVAAPRIHRRDIRPNTHTLRRKCRFDRQTWCDPCRRIPMRKAPLQSKPCPRTHGPCEPQAVLDFPSGLQARSGTRIPWRSSPSSTAREGSTRSQTVSRGRWRKRVRVEPCIVRSTVRCTRFEGDSCVQLVPRIPSATVYCVGKKRGRNGRCIHRRKFNGVFSSFQSCR